MNNRRLQEASHWQNLQRIATDVFLKSDQPSHLVVVLEDGERRDVLSLSAVFSYRNLALAEESALLVEGEYLPFVEDEEPLVGVHLVDKERLTGDAPQLQRERDGVFDEVLGS